MSHPPKVLVVDDEPDLVRYLEHVLHRLGYETARAENGSEAIERAALDPPDLILLDVMMPVMDGVTFARALRGADDPAVAKTPIVLVTAVADAENVRRQIGAADVIPKPIDMDKVVAAVGRHCRHDCLSQS
jgi:two-component system, chemotaxis family, chemotaxis protein CheY